MSDVFECTDVDGCITDRFQAQLERGEAHDHVAPYGPLRVCVDDAAVDADDIRQQLAAELWEACELDNSQGYLRESERLQRLNLGSSSLRDRYAAIKLNGKRNLKEKFEAYFAVRDIHCHDASADYANQQVAKLWPKGRARLKPIPLDDAVCMFKPDTNFGFPRCTTDHEANFHYYYLESCRIQDRGFCLADASDYPCIATTRTQAAGYHEVANDRALSMYCRALCNGEKQYQRSGFDAFCELDEFVAWKGQTAVDIAITRLLDDAPGEVLSVDFTQFDASVPFEVLRHVFGIMASWFTRESGAQIRFLAEAFMRTGIVLPDGYRHGDERTGGIPSGSGWTNWVDSIANLWVWHYAVHRDRPSTGRVLKALVNGDDGVLCFKGISSIPRLSEILFNDLGMLVKMDPAKNLISGEHVRFLQMDHHVSYRVEGLLRGVRPVNRILPKMTGFERRLPVKRLGLRDEPPTRWRGLFNTYRWLQQMEPARYHPNFDGFMLWHHEHDRELRGCLEAIARGDKVVTIACQMTGSSDGEEQLTLKGLRNSEVVKRLRKLCGLD